MASWNDLYPPSTFWYFFSTLTQSAAAFAALASVFAVFRLQANDDVVENTRQQTWAWLFPRLSESAKRTFSPNNVEELLNQITTKKREEPLISMEDTSTWLAQLREQMNFPNELGYKVSVPLKHWAIIFFISLSSLLWPSAKMPCAFFIVAIGILVYTGFALCSTKNFIQTCLGVRKNLS